MVSKERLIDFYLEQYRLAVETHRPGKGRMRDAGQRSKRLAGNLHAARAGRIGFAMLEDFHKQIRNMQEYAIRQKNREIQERVEKEMIPDLVRLDLGFLMPEQREGIDEDFLTWVEEKRSLVLCRKPLFALYPAYKEMIITEQMTQLVPTRPELEFPEALAMRRRFIVHVGPTNSGKTFQALERLRTARKGIYLGPLRLLALEVYEKMRDEGVPATMLTGQERIEDEDSRITAATVEMADLSQRYEIAVIDEAQLMADPERGHSWTRALLGLMADEIHVCCSPAAEEVVKHLITLCNDTFEVHHYERKTSLLFESEPFVFPEDVRQGDALIVFSKKSVLDVAGRLEEQGIEASVIYGSLPPEIRRRQMHLFTEGKTRVVVSTDAIGMGLNLPVRRIIFLQASKFDGREQRLITTSEIRQIAGRAGRFGIYDTGYVSAIDDETLSYLREMYDHQEETVTRVNLGFPQVLLDIDEPLDEILKVWHDQQPEPPFEKENIDEALYLYDRALSVKEYIPGFEDKHLLYRMISCPIDIKDRKVVDLWLDYCLYYTADVSLAKPRLDKREKSGLAKYETYYKQLDLYYQMSYRLGKIMDEEWIRKERMITEDRIMRYLLREKSRYIKRCRFCGRILPIDYPFNCCDRCYRGGRQLS